MELNGVPTHLNIALVTLVLFGGAFAAAKVVVAAVEAAAAVAAAGQKTHDNHGSLQAATQVMCKPVHTATTTSATTATRMHEPIWDNELMRRCQESDLLEFHKSATNDNQK